ncbi:hypothetical protein [Lapillicoccus jejuensis]|uniref:Beta-propeller uncharacterized protein DUF5122 n=1 Tax=Lapillicoccus jejuensis TaxID=402171 RepID=A0A542E242_9MICO|nr:hypothetical protein [Lapillicoccus jejuensis]TQJ09398.1 beta-propeller uncharacterized protein DUF5122 [Lapillicoccus jejuensis]
MRVHTPARPSDRPRQPGEGSVTGRRPGRRTALAAAAAALVPALLAGTAATSATAATAALPAGPALAATADTTWWGTNGRVMDIVTDGRSAWLGGGFDYVGPTTGHGVVVDAASGAVTSAGSLVVDGTVEASVADGAGGYYLGGSFLRAGTSRRVGLLHVKADGTIDRTFAPTVTGTVHALAVSGGRLVVGGELSAVSGTAVTNLVALAADGSVDTSWTAPTDGAVWTLAAAGDAIYVGGRFGTVRGVARANLARLSAVDGSVAPDLTARPDSTVRALAVRPGTTHAQDLVVLGGDFGTVATPGGTATAPRLTALTGAGAATGWAPAPDASVATVALSPTGALLAGGSFRTVAGQGRVAVAEFAPGGALLPFDARLAGCHLPHTTKDTNQLVACSTTVSAVSFSADGARAFVGGLFTTTQGVVRHDVASYDVATGAVTAWSPMPGAWVRTVTPVGTGVVLGGDFTSVGGLYRAGLAKIDLSTGRADPAFQADVDNMVLDLELDATRSSLYVGGSFRTVGGVVRNKVAKLDPATGAVDATFRTGANKDVQTLAVRGGSLFYGGLFTQVGQTTRLRAAKVSATTGAVDTTWRADTTGPAGVRRDGVVYSLAASADGSRVFLAGGFTAVNGVAVNGIVALDGTTGALTPSRLGGIRGGCGDNFIKKLYLSPDGQRLWGGDLCPDYIYQWDAVSLAQSKPFGLNFVTFCNAGMQGAVEVGGRFYMGSHGGDRGRGGSCWVSPSNTSLVTQSRAMAFDAGTGALQAWSPLFDSPMGVWSYAVVPQGLLVGGDFSVAGDRNTLQQGLALFRGTP